MYLQHDGHGGGHVRAGGLAGGAGVQEQEPEHVERVDAGAPVAPVVARVGLFVFVGLARV
jgi:hypothetical protein